MAGGPRGQKRPPPVRSRPAGRRAPPVDGRANPNRPRFTKEEAAAALLKTGGLISVAAAALRVTPESVRRALKRWPTLRPLLEEAKDAILDDTEWALFRAARSGEPWAVQYLLRHHGKQRGYQEVRKTEEERRVQVEVTYSADALAAGRPDTVVTQLPPPANAEPPHIEVVEAEVVLTHAPDTESAGG